MTIVLFLVGAFVFGFILQTLAGRKLSFQMDFIPALAILLLSPFFDLAHTMGKTNFFVALAGFALGVVIAMVRRAMRIGSHLGSVRNPR